jgi:Tfp pilus assembly PilM family ATPase
MKFSWSSTSEPHIGALIEIGSGSVLGSIVCSYPSKQHPEIIWTKREFATLTADFDFARSIKAMLTALMNVAIGIDNEGRDALRSTIGDHQIETLQVSISAPWAYTISKVIEYESDESFTITDSLIKNLIDKANERTLEVLRESEKENNSGLTIMTRATTDITANGYHTMEPIDQTATVVTLTQVSAIAQNLITTAVSDLKARILPKTELERYSTMLIFHSTIKELYPEMTEYCLVDLTYEATELAIIRDGVLQYSTHTNIGINTIIRNVALRLDIPQGDAETLLKQVFGADTFAGISDKAKAVIETIFKEYQDALETLFHETGDSLAIPKILFLHSSYVHERFFDNFITDAAKAATSSSHTVHTLTHELMLTTYTGDSKISIIQKDIDTRSLMLAQFFHKQGVRHSFTQV